MAGTTHTHTHTCTRTNTHTPSRSHLLAVQVPQAQAQLERQQLECAGRQAGAVGAQFLIGAALHVLCGGWGGERRGGEARGACVGACGVQQDTACIRRSVCVRVCQGEPSCPPAVSPQPVPYLPSIHASSPFPPPRSAPCTSLPQPPCPAATAPSTLPPESRPMPHSPYQSPLPDSPKMRYTLPVLFVKDPKDGAKDESIRLQHKHA